MTEKLIPIVCESISVQYDLEQDRLILTLHAADTSFFTHVTSRFSRVFVQTLFKNESLVTYFETTKRISLLIEDHGSLSGKKEEGTSLASSSQQGEPKIDLLTTFDITFHAEATVIAVKISGVAMTLSLTHKDLHNLLLIMCRKVQEAEWNYHYWPAWLKRQVEQSMGSKIVH